MPSSSISAETLLWARNRDPENSSVGPWNDVVAGLLNHRSVRNFAADPLPQGLVPTLIAAAQSAASSSNLQTWSVVAVQDRARKVRLSELAGNQAFIREAPLFLVWLADLSRNERVAAERQTELEAIHYLETLFIGIIDVALAAQNAVVALESLGLGAVYVGAIRNKPEQVAAELGLPSRVMPVFGMAIGYPDPGVSNAVKPRLPQRAVLHSEQYDENPQADAVLHYDAQLSDFQREQNLAVIGWLGRTIPRLKSVKSLAGRDRMREALSSLGFELR
jgi:nitroreductase